MIPKWIKRAVLLLGISIFILSSYILNQNKIVEACVNQTCVQSWHNDDQSYHTFCWCDDPIGGGGSGGGGGGGGIVPTSTPVPTLIPTPQNICALRPQGDANCDNIVNMADYDIFKSMVSGK